MSSSIATWGPSGRLAVGEPSKPISQHVAEILDGTQSATLPADEATGRRARGATEKARETVSITDFDDVIPGSAAAMDDAIQAAIENVDDGTMIEVPPQDYRMSAQIPIQRSNIGLRFAPGSRFVTDIVSNSGLYVLGAEPTVYVNLDADAAEGARSVSVADASTFAKGQWVEVRSETVLIGSTNNNSKKQGEIFKITGIATNVIHLSGTLRYAYTTADTAKIGIATVRENITIEGYRWNPAAAGPGTTALRGFQAEYAAHLTIRDFQLCDNRTLDGADITAASGIKLVNVHDVLVEHGRLENIGYYGVEINGIARFVTMRDIYASRCRHSVSLVDGGTYGEPIDIHHDRLTSEYSLLSGFDTHDVGKDISYSHCISRWAADDGFQNRCSKVTYDHCLAVGATNDGFSSDYQGPAEGRYNHCEARNNGRNGINYTGYDLKVKGGRYYNNGTISTTGAGIAAFGADIDGAEITENDKAIHWGSTSNFTMGRLDVRNVTAPQSAKQTDFIRLYNGGDAGAGTYENCSVRDCWIPNYTTNFWKWVANAVRTDWPATSGNVLKTYAAGVEMKGLATLVAGTVTVTTSAVRKYAGAAAAASSCPIYSRIRLQLITAGGTPGILRISAVTDNTSFVITSSDAADTSVVFWEIIH